MRGYITSIYSHLRPMKHSRSLLKIFLVSVNVKRMLPGRFIQGINSYAMRQLSLGGLEPSDSHLLSGLQENSEGLFAILPVIPPADLGVREHSLFTNRVES